MSEPEIKMEKFGEIIALVDKLRDLELRQRSLGKDHGRLNEALEDFGIRCNNSTNCIAVGKLCFKCRNNYARRSYFRDLLKRGVSVDIYANEASCFAAIESGE